MLPRAAMPHDSFFHRHHQCEINCLRIPQNMSEQSLSSFEKVPEAALLGGGHHNMSHDNPAFSEHPSHTDAADALSTTTSSYGTNQHTVVNVSDLKGAACNANAAKTPQQQQAPPPAYNSISSKEAEAAGYGASTGIFTVGDALSRKASVAQQEYKPHLERDVEKPITNMETLLHLLKGSLGTGILAMPNAFMHAGYAVGIVGTFIIGVLCTYCIHLLVKAQYELCRRRRIPSLGYQETAMAALEEGPRFLRPLAPYTGHIVNIFLLIYQLGTCCVYVVFVSSNIKSVVDEYYSGLDLRMYMLILLLPLIMINMVRNLKLLAPFTTLANLLTLIGFGITLYYLVNSAPTLADKEPFGTLKGLPLFFGTVLFALEAIGVILPLENSMKTPKSFGGSLGVLNRAMVVIITLYIGIGFFGYMKYGSCVKGSITLNLPNEEILAQCVKIMLAISIFITHSLQNYVAIDITWNGYLSEKLEKHPHKVIFEYLVRVSLVIVTFLLAVAIPNLELFISLFGALCLSALGIAFPAIIQSCTFWNKETTQLKFILMVMKNSFLVLFAALGLIVGTYISISDIIKEFS
ncbi:proton-coupled amino acid transporter-like protein CG1139 isoform X1 [Schistocerca gregaria]|uniref:proton-coupled amino acid transporter-like protein CG1139 isoform X1 n=2 Tax=Schistocerca gregaria TaxID=7010 RepID=UPI00211F4293|nr:proton-coupled amino acid transporter-like protein CG1139 isoform X1 [Schistocerca gregaria]